MTDELKAKKEDRPEVDFIKNKKKKKPEPIKKDNSITIWSSKKGWKNDRNVGHRPRSLNDDYLNRCIEVNKRHQRGDLIMGLVSLFFYVSFFILAYLSRGWR